MLVKRNLISQEDFDFLCRKHMNQQDVTEDIKSLQENHDFDIQYVDDKYYINLRGISLKFKKVLFENIDFDNCKYADIIFDDCKFVNCKFNCRFVGASVVSLFQNCDFLHCRFDLLKCAAVSMKSIINAHFECCDFDTVAIPKIENAVFRECRGHIVFLGEATDIYFLRSDINAHFVDKNTNNIKAKLSSMKINIIRGCFSDVVFDSSLIVLLSEDELIEDFSYIKKSNSVILRNIIASKTEIKIANVDSFNLKSNYGVISTLYSEVEPSIYCKDAVITSKIGSRSARTIYHVANDLVICGCWSTNELKGIGGSLENFEKRVNEVYPESSDDPNHKKYREEYMDAIKKFKEARKEYVDLIAQ